MPGRNLAMAREATQFSGDGVKLSWPRGGTREICPKPPFLSHRLNLRIANGFIVETDEEATVSLPEEPATRLLTGEAARQRLAEPGKPRVLAVARIADESKRLPPRPLSGQTATLEAEPEPESKPRRTKGALLQKGKKS